MQHSKEHIILKALQGDVLSAEEREHLSHCHDEFKDFSDLIKAYDEEKSETESLLPLPDWQDVVERSGRQERKKFLKMMIAAAAILIAVMGVNWFVSFKKHVNSNQFIIANENPRQFKHPVNGAEISIQPGSRLAVLSDHHLSLHGEAYFDVPPQAEPLLIYSGDVLVKVIGTRFLIKSQEKSDLYELHLEEGILEVKYRDHTWTLVAGETLNIDKKEKKGRILKAKKTSGEGFLELKSMTLDQIIVAIERHFNISIQLDPALSNERYTLQLPDNDARKALEILADVCDAKLSVTDSGNYLLMK